MTTLWSRMYLKKITKNEKGFRRVALVAYKDENTAFTNKGLGERMS